MTSYVSRVTLACTTAIIGCTAFRAHEPPELLGNAEKAISRPFVSWFFVGTRVGDMVVSATDDTYSTAECFVSGNQRTFAQEPAFTVERGEQPGLHVTCSSTLQGWRQPVMQLVCDYRLDKTSVAWLDLVGADAEQPLRGTFRGNQNELYDVESTHISRLGLSSIAARGFAIRSHGSGELLAFVDTAFAPAEGWYHVAATPQVRQDLAPLLLSLAVVSDPRGANNCLPHNGSFGRLPTGNMP